MIISRKETHKSMGFNGRNPCGVGAPTAVTRPDEQSSGASGFKRKTLMDRCVKRLAGAEDAEPCDRSLWFNTNGTPSG